MRKIAILGIGQVQSRLDGTVGDLGFRVVRGRQQRPEEQHQQNSDSKHAWHDSHGLSQYTPALCLEPRPRVSLEDHSL